MGKKRFSQWDGATGGAEQARVLGEMVFEFIKSVLTPHQAPERERLELMTVVEKYFFAANSPPLLDFEQAPVKDTRAEVLPKTLSKRKLVKRKKPKAPEWSNAEDDHIEAVALAWFREHEGTSQKLTV